MTKKSVCVICSKEREISEIFTKVNEMHKELMGNGREGLITKWNEFQGALGVWKWLAGSGCVFAMVALILTIVRGG